MTILRVSSVPVAGVLDAFLSKLQSFFNFHIEQLVAKGLFEEHKYQNKANQLNNHKLHHADIDIFEIPLRDDPFRKYAERATGGLSHAFVNSPRPGYQTMSDLRSIQSEQVSKSAE